jgi:hypothetical protein
MTSESIGFEIRERTAPDGGVVLELVVEGSLLARATASSTALDDLRTELGYDRAAVVADLRRSLRGVFKTEKQFVEISDMKEGPPLRFAARFTYRLKDEIATGMVWYDVNSSTTGPDDLSPVVRNEMRFEVLRRLTREGSNARALVDHG